MPALGSVDVHSALASAPRRRVLETLREAAEPLDAGAIARTLELHVTTARFHLEQLEAAGLVARAAGVAGHTEVPRRGRPRVFFVAVEAVAAVEYATEYATESAGIDRDDHSREQLIEVLAAALAAQGTTEAARKAESAGRDWARVLIGAGSGSSSDAPGEGADAALEQVLAELGFVPERAGSEILLRACPFREAARQHPEVVCAVHRGLVDELLSPDQRADGVRLLPFVQPDLCAIAVPGD